MFGQNSGMAYHQTVSTFDLITHTEEGAARKGNPITYSYSRTAPQFKERPAPTKTTKI